MAQRAPGDGYYDRLNKEQRALSTDMQQNREERVKLREAFAAASHDQKKELQPQIDANVQALEALYDKYEELRECQTNPPWIALSMALSNAQYAKVEELTRDGKLIKMMNEEQVSILGQPAYAGDTKIAKLLIERGADLEMRGGELHETPLQTATYKDSAGVFKALVEAGADLTVKNADGKSLRQMAKQYGADNILDYLDKIEKKAKKKPAPQTAKPK